MYRRTSARRFRASSQSYNNAGPSFIMTSYRLGVWIRRVHITGHYSINTIYHVLWYLTGIPVRYCNAYTLYYYASTTHTVLGSSFHSNWKLQPRGVYYNDNNITYRVTHAPHCERRRRCIITMVLYYTKHTARRRV